MLKSIKNFVVGAKKTLMIVFLRSCLFVKKLQLYFKTALNKRGKFFFLQMIILNLAPL